MYMHLKYIPCCTYFNITLRESCIYYNLLFNTIFDSYSFIS